ncbi:MAG: hypothetical protein Q7S43_05490, partial [bacterium]|nr:hypothetical protein [bacterium]
SHHRRIFERCQGSTHNHQNWSGGYIDHITEVMNFAVLLWMATSLTGRRVPKLSDALLVLFLHDIEKPWKYEEGPDGELQHRPQFKTAEDQHRFVERKIAEYGIVLNDEQLNALRYVHGELNDYSSRKRAMNELAAFCHMCDVWIARGWHDYPLENNDPCSGAGRLRMGR